MNRRAFVRAACASAATWGGVARSQDAERLPVVAVLTPGPSDLGLPRVAALRDGLTSAGLAEGTQYVIAFRFADGHFERLPALARELGALRPAVVVASANAVPVAHEMLPQTPIVFTSYGVDPVKRGLAQSFARPGGMVTGNLQTAMGGEDSLTEKRIGFLKELVPDLARVGMVGPRTGLLSQTEREALRRAANRIGFSFSDYPVDAIEDVAGALAAGLRDGVSGFYISGEPLLFNNMRRVMPEILAAGRPTAGVYPEWARAGLLMCYSTDVLDGFRRAGLYAAKIIRGASPGELPIEQTSRFTLAVNAKTAARLGITVPATVLAVADEIIE